MGPQTRDAPRLGTGSGEVVLVLKDLADKGKVLPCSTSLGVGLTASHPYKVPDLPAVEDLRDGGLLPALGSHLPGPSPA